jgi:putative membrane protein insertion efficiency factor
MRVFIGRFLWYFYKGCFAPFIPHTCRFYPSCSVYACEVFERHGIKGVPWIVWRILRCNPWGGSGYDPVSGAKPPCRELECDGCSDYGNCQK